MTKPRVAKVAHRRVATVSTVVSSAAPAPVSTLVKRNMSAAAGVPNNGWVEGPNGVKRPISPSIQIWKFAPEAYIHVGVRIAACVLTGGFTLAGLTAAFGTCDVPAVLDQIKVAAPVLVPVLKASIVAPLVYHGLGGARQIFQDVTAKGYDHDFQEKTSYAIAGATALATLYGAAI